MFHQNFLLCILQIKTLTIANMLLIFKVFDMQAIDFLDKLLRYDHQDRLTAKEAMVILR